MPGGNVRPFDTRRAIARLRPSSAQAQTRPAELSGSVVRSPRPLQNETRFPTLRGPEGKHGGVAMTWHLLMKTLTVKDGERALLTRNGRLERVLEPSRHRLFDLRRQLTVEIFSVVRAEFPAERYAVLKAARPDLAAELFEAVETKANEIAIVRLDGRPLHLLSPWQTRVFWKVDTKIDVERIDVTADPTVEPRHLAMIDRKLTAYV